MPTPATTGPDEQIVTPKQWTLGTHRACAPEATYERIRPHLHEAGITRLADVTGLDKLRIPTYQAIRPAARNVSVAMGKGVTPLLAKVSAVMESLEHWHAEKWLGDVYVGTAAEFADVLTYDPGALARPANSIFHSKLPLKWIKGQGLCTNKATLVPLVYVALDFTVAPGWFPPLFTPTSNGLAGGNTREEATVHALYEVIERHCIAVSTADDRARLDLASVEDGAAEQVLNWLRVAGTNVEVVLHDDPFGITCFEATIHGGGHPARFTGHGAHLDKDVALSRALTEAAQARLTYISGARDDLHPALYDSVRDGAARPSAAGELCTGRRSFQELSSRTESTFSAELSFLAQGLAEVSGYEPVLVDLTRPKIGLPVVKVIAPGLKRRNTLALHCAYP